jgi:hypothetical protein
MGSPRPSDRAAPPSGSLAFKNHLTAIQLVLQVDIKDAQYRLSRLRDYLRVYVDE